HTPSPRAALRRTTRSWSGTGTGRRAVVGGAILEHLTGEPYARAQYLRAGAPLVVAPPRPVTGPGEHCTRIARQDRGHGFEQRAQAVAGLDPPEEQEPRMVGEGVCGPAPVGLEEGRVHAVRDDVPLEVEMPRVCLDDRLTHRNRGGVAVEDLLERAPEHPAAERAREPRMKGGDHGNPGPPCRERGHEPQRGGQAAVDVHEVVAPCAEQLLQPPT